MKRRHIGRLALALFWVMAYGSSAHADSRSRAEVQGGAAFLNTTPALAIGGTGWINRRAGVSARVYFMRSGDLEDPRHIETMFRLRRFVGKVEIDVGMGLGSSIEALGSDLECCGRNDDCDTHGIGTREVRDDGCAAWAASWQTLRGETGSGSCRRDGRLGFHREVFGGVASGEPLTIGRAATRGEQADGPAHSFAAPPPRRRRLRSAARTSWKRTTRTPRGTRRRRRRRSGS